MKAIDMRVRPPMPSLFDTTMYDQAYAAKFAHKFDGSYTAQSAKIRSVEMLLEEMDECNIEIGVYEIGIHPQIDMNQEAWDILGKYQNRFKAMIGANPVEIEKSLADINKYAANDFFVGVNMDPANPILDDKSKYYDDESLFVIYEKCEEENLPITMAFGGYAYPDVKAYRVERIENIVRTFPKLKLCFCHGCWPYFAQMCGLSMRYNNIYYSPDSYLMGLPGSEDYVAAANYVLPDRIMFGTSYPFHAQKKVYDYYLQSAFRPEVLPKVMYENAKKFLQLK